MKFSAPLVLLAVSGLVGCGATHENAGSASGNANEADSGQNPCGIHSGYKGDELCITPPNPGEGIQIHVGPESYDNPDEVAPYLLPAGQETVDCFNAAIPDSNFWYLRQENRMRPSSHHMLIFAHNDPSLTVGPSPSTCDDIAHMVAFIPGSQTPSSNFPDKLGPEDSGIGRNLPQANIAAFQMHYINTGTTPVLREAWVNLYKTDAANVTAPLQNIFFVGDIAISIPPGTRQTTTIQDTPPLTSPTRLFEVNAHMHAHAEHFTFSVIHNGQEQVLYQSFNWEEPYSNTFNSVVKNPMWDETAKKDGGISGDFSLQPGDTLKWACDVNNTLSTTIHFDNKAQTAEMCMLVGSYIGQDPMLMSGLCAGGHCTTGFPQQATQ
jgi:hypothetical protein